MATLLLVHHVTIATFAISREVIDQVGQLTYLMAAFLTIDTVQVLYRATVLIVW